MCPSGAICLPTDLFQWASNKYNNRWLTPWLMQCSFRWHNSKKHCIRNVWSYNWSHLHFILMKKKTIGPCYYLGTYNNNIIFFLWILNFQHHIIQNDLVTTVINDAIPKTFCSPSSSFTENLEHNKDYFLTNAWH